MKKLFLAFSLFSGVWAFSQAYIDSNGNLQRRPYQYRDPQQLDISGLGNAATTLQNRYNNNAERVQYEVNKIIKRVYQFEISDEQKEEIVTRFKNTAVRSINTQRINYSSDAETNSVINYLYDSINKITHQVTD